MATATSRARSAIRFRGRRGRDSEGRVVRVRERVVAESVAVQRGGDLNLVPFARSSDMHRSRFACLPQKTAAPCSSAHARVLTMSAACGSAQRALLYNDSVRTERYWCPYLSSARLHSSVPRLAQQPLAAAFGRGVSFYLVGDSVTAQHFRSIACAIGVDRTGASMLLENQSGRVPLRKWDACYARGDAPSSRLCYAQGGSVVPHRHGQNSITWTEMPVVTQVAALIELVASGMLRRGDVLLLNEGVHFR